LENLLKFNIYKPVNNMIPEDIEELKNKSFNVTKYKQAIGSLMYLELCTRPDILFTINKTSRKSKNPTYEEWFNLLKIFRYLKDKCSQSWRTCEELNRSI